MYKGNTLGFFLKWVTCGTLHPKDLLNEEGNLKSHSDFSNCIEDKSNWKCKFYLLCSSLYVENMIFYTANM